MAKLALKKNIQQIEKVGGRAGNDTLRLWEGYRDQALLWRAISLLQIPATTLAIAAALIMYFSADTIIEVPEKPLPGYYSVRQLPDAEFIAVASDVVNMISSYQPQTAEAQFSSARRYLWEPALSIFEEKMMITELEMINDTSRSQLFFVDKNLIQVERYPAQDKVVVRLPGTRLKLIGPRPLPVEKWTYFVTMTTIPRNVHNPYGIVIIDIKILEGSQVNPAHAG